MTHTVKDPVYESDLQAARKACEDVVVAAAGHRVRVSARGIRALAPELAAFRALIRGGSVVALKPEVTPDEGVFQYMGLYVSPRAKLTDGRFSVELSGRLDLAFQDGDLDPYIPAAVVAGVSDKDFIGLADLPDGLIEPFVRGVRDGLEPFWIKHQEDYSAHWTSVSQGLKEIVEASVRSRRSRVRKGFRSKMASALIGCEAILDEDPEFLLRIMKLEPAELISIVNAAADCRSDLIVATAEDVQDVLNDMRVRRTMES